MGGGRGFRRASWIGVIALLVALGVRFHTREVDPLATAPPVGLTGSPRIPIPASAVPVPAVQTAPPIPGMPAGSRSNVSLAARVAAGESSMESVLSRRSPAEGLAYLEGILSRPSPPLGDRLQQERIERILAARYLCKVAEADPSLIPTVLRLSRTRAGMDADPVVRMQLLWNLSGTVLQPITGTLREGDREREAEGFSAPTRPPPPPEWMGSLRKTAAEHEDLLLPWLREASLDRRAVSRDAALEALLSMPSDAAHALAYEVFRTDPTARASMAERMALAAGPEVLDLFTQTLPDTRDSLTLRTMARAMEQGSRLPENAGQALFEAFQRHSTDPGSEDQARTRAVLAKASVRSAILNGDEASRACVSKALEDPSIEVLEGAIESIVAGSAEPLGATIREIWAAEGSPYRKTLLAYGLRAAVPGFQEPNPWWELRELQARPTPSEADRQRIRVLEAELRALRPR